MEKNTNLIELANYFNELIKQGIVVDGEKIPFTMLDYYTISGINKWYFLSLLNTRNVEGLNHNTYLRQFLEKTNCTSNEIDNAEEILDQHHVFIVNGVRFAPSKEDVEMIFNLFDENNIPRYNRLIYTALNRMARGQKILPLVNSEEKRNSK